MYHKKYVKLKIYLCRVFFRFVAMSCLHSQQKVVSPEEILSKRVICEPLTIAMSAPTGDGGAAVVLCSEEFLLQHNLQVLTVCISSPIHYQD